ncbi:MAG: hypothetical protein WA951_14200, partial [Leeuwenhoekiella sp.]
MYILLIAVFVLGYICIALEHNLKIDKAAAAILTGVICWVILIIGEDVLLTTMNGGEAGAGLMEILDITLL